MADKVTLRVVTRSLDRATTMRQQTRYHHRLLLLLLPKEPRTATLEGTISCRSCVFWSQSRLYFSARFPLHICISGLSALGTTARV